MLERLGNVLYWFGCGLAGLVLIVGLLIVGIEVMRGFDPAKPFKIVAAPEQAAPKLLSDAEMGFPAPKRPANQDSGIDDWITKPAEATAKPAPGSHIFAQSADGVIHDFPAGTDMSVIDRVMKSYASDARWTTPHYDTYKVWSGLAIGCFALISWLIGRACRYILSGR